MKARQVLAGTLIRALLLFTLANAACALVDPFPWLARLTLYNGLVAGRERLPYGENPAQSYNLSLNSLDVMFSTHAISAPKAPGEIRVVLIGDSAVWGVLLDNRDTLAGQLNAASVTDSGGKAHYYNLGYPVQSLTKDLLILDYALRFQPDRIVWLVTLESFARSQQTAAMLVRSNQPALAELDRRFDLRLDPNDPAARFITPTVVDRTLIGRRRELADWLRLQLYGLPWASTGIDQQAPRFFEPRMENFRPESFDGDLLRFKTFTPDNPFTEQDVAFDALAAGIQAAGSIPVDIINEPIFRSGGLNSDVRYNFFYPRWAYDRYRQMLADVCRANGWTCLDLWDAIPPSEFTDSAVHLTPRGSAMLAERLMRR